MRILFALHAWPPSGRGGTEIHARDLALQLSSRGHQVGVFVRAAHPDRPRYEVTTSQCDGIGITSVNNCFWETPTLEWVTRNQAIHEAFEREIDEFKPDLVHIHHLLGLSTTIVETLKSRGIPTVITLHDFWSFCPRGQRMTPSLDLCETIDRVRCSSCLAGMWPHLFHDEDKRVVDLRGGISPSQLAEWDRHMVYTLNLCDLMIAPSEFHRERLLDHPLDADRFVTLTHGLDPALFGEAKRELGASPRRIGYIGSVIPPKGVHILVEAFRLLDRPETSLHIHGDCPSFHEDQNYAERLKGFASPRHSITLHGAYDPREVPQILKNLDILVVPSLWWEAFCLTLREGLLAGIPVVASDHGAMREALDGERDGLLFRTGDPRDLKDRLESLLDDSRLWARYANRGAVVKGPKTHVQEMEALYERARKIAGERSDLVVAPSWFPEPPAPEPLPAEVSTVETIAVGSESSAPLPWDRIGVALRQEGSLRVALDTKRPTSEDPLLAVQIRLSLDGREVGRLGLDVDLEALRGGATRALATIPAQTPDREARRAALARKPSLRRLEVPSGGKKGQRFQVKRLPVTTTRVDQRPPRSD